MYKTILVFVLLAGCLDEDARPYNEFVQEAQNLPDTSTSDMSNSDSTASDTEDASDIPTDFSVPQICGTVGGEFIRVRFFNQTGATGKVFRIEEDCTATEVLELNEVDRPFQDSAVGEVWSFRNANDREIARVRVETVFDNRIDFKAPQ